MAWAKEKYCDYTTVTETPSTRASKEQLARLYTRYRFAAEYCKNKDVLEVACGAGIGLGYIARFANKAVGGDIDEGNLEFAQYICKKQKNVEVMRLDAHNLPFEDNSFDVVILYEAIYYLSHPDRFIDEARRVLKKRGELLICTANKDWPDFNPSPYSIKYFSANEIYALLKEKAFDVNLFANCPIVSDDLKSKLISIIKKAAVKIHLIPKTMKGKEVLKRIFFGKLVPLPPEVTDDMGITYFPPVPIPHDILNTKYKVLFAVAYIR